MENLESNEARWYYISANKKLGPVSEDVIVSLVRHNILCSETFVSSDEMKSWRVLKDTSLWEQCQIVENELEPISVISGDKRDDADFDKKINGYYFQFWLWSIIGIPLLVIVIGLAPLLVATVFECFILYHAWKAIPNNRYGVPPILAVILIFAPIAGSIWCFWAYFFMSKEMNQALTQRGDTYRVNESLVLTTCVLSCITAAFCSVPTIPTFVIGMIILVPTVIVGIFSVRSIKDGILALHRYEKANFSIV